MILQNEKNIILFIINFTFINKIVKIATKNKTSAKILIIIIKIIFIRHQMFMNLHR